MKVQIDDYVKNLPRFREKNVEFHFKDCLTSWLTEQVTLWGYNKCPEMVNHGLLHAFNVMQNCISILKTFPAVYRSMSDEEWFLVLSACWLHDIGMQCGRKGHGRATAKLLTNSDPEYRHIKHISHLRDEEAILIGKLSAFHMSNMPIDERQEEQLKQSGGTNIGSPIEKTDTIYGKEIRLRFLAALLSLADACDVQYTREGTLAALYNKNHQNELLANNLEKYKDEAEYVRHLRNQKEHLHKHAAIREIRFVLEEILLVPVLEDDEYRESLDGALRQIQDELYRGGGVLAECGVLFKTVRISTIPLEHSLRLASAKAKAYQLNLGACCSDITFLIKQAYVLLRLDQVPETGNWGRTIDKYIRINFPDKPRIISQIPFYEKEGSITHTAHALKGLSCLAHFYRGQKVEGTQIFDWIVSQQRKYGLIEPDIPANPDEICGYAKAARHTATSIISVHYLLKIKYGLTIPAKEQMFEWLIEMVKTLLEFSLRWAYDKEMTYSYAYLIHCYDLASSYKELDADLLAVYDESIYGLDRLFSMLNSNDPYWCTDTHPQARVFYTLFMLSFLLESPILREDSTWIQKCRTIISSIGKNRNNDGGLSFAGNGGRSDPGVTAMFLNVVSKYAQSEEEYGYELAQKVADPSIKYLANVSKDLFFHSDKLLTHGYAAILELLESTNLLEQPGTELLDQPLRKLIDEGIKMRNTYGYLDSEAVREIDNLLRADNSITRIFIRDIEKSERSRI